MGYGEAPWIFKGRYEAIFADRFVFIRAHSLDASAPQGPVPVAARQER